MIVHGINAALERRAAGCRGLLHGERGQLKSRIVRRLIAVVRIGRQTRANQPVKRGRCDRLQLGAERLAAGCHLVDHRAERVDVAPRVGRRAFEHLGGHVLHGAHHHAGAGDRKRRGDGLVVHGRLGRRFREPEVEELGTRAGQHHVRRLEIPVDDAVPMRLVERIRDLAAVPDDVLDRQRPLGQALRQRLALEELHDQEIDAVCAGIRVADVIEGADMRV